PPPPPPPPHRPPLVQPPAPLDHPLRRVRHCARGDLRPALIDDPDRMRLIGPIDADVVAHSPSSFFWRRGRGAGTAGWPYTGPPGDHFLLNLWRRSLADRDSLSRSLWGLGAPRSSDVMRTPGWPWEVRSWRAYYHPPNHRRAVS